MSSGFREMLFEPRISAGTQGGPRWSTDVVQPETPNESRNRNWSHPIWEWDLKSSIHTREQWDYVLNFFLGVAQGRAYGFRWRDRSFNRAMDNVHYSKPLIGQGTASAYQFQLIKKCGYGSYLYSMPINKPVDGTVKIYIDDARIMPDDATYGWSVDTTTGLVTFTDSGVFDGNEKSVYADYQFDFPVRFDEDYFPSSWVDYDKHRFSIPIVSLNQVDNTP